MAKPVTPDEVVPLKAKILPDFVLEAVNEIVAERYLGGRAKFTQNEVMQKILTKAEAAGKPLTRAQAYANHYLDFEDIYRAAGWQVVYDKPGYNEDYEPTFSFRRK